MYTIPRKGTRITVFRRGRLLRNCRTVGFARNAAPKRVCSKKLNKGGSTLSPEANEGRYSLAVTMCANNYYIGKMVFYPINND